MRKKILEKGKADALKKKASAAAEKIRPYLARVTRVTAGKNGKIGYKLIAGFCVPVLLIIVLGTVSYRLAKSSIQTQYEQSVTDTVSSMSLNCKLLCESIQNKAAEIASNDYIQTYYNKAYAANASESQDCYRSATEILTTAKGTSSYMYSFSVFGENGNGITSASGNTPKDAYAQYMETNEGKRFASGSGNVGYWSGYHAYVDENLSIDTTKYAITYTRPFAKGNGFICLDIGTDAIREVLSNIDNGADSYVVLFTPDGRALTMQEDALVSVDTFSGSKVEETALGAAESGSSYLSFEGKKYLLSVSPIGKSGMTIASLVPKAQILASASKIRNVTILVVLFACVTALFIGSVLAKGISREVNQLNRQMKKVSDGDFTTQFATKRKDEFRALTYGMTEMLEHIRQLMQNVVQFITQVNASSDGVSATADTMAHSIMDINAAMEEVAQGVSKQAEDTDSSLQDMSGFSEKLNHVYEDTSDMQKNSKQAVTAIEQGKQMVRELSDKSKAAAEITDVLIKNIADVEENSGNIGSIIETIREIAEQTNLLSLNASIEAARAGEAGRGFSVVAEEIRKLAEQSKEAGKRIRSIVAVIQEKTQITSDSAKRAEDFLHNQAASIEGTVDVFGEINENVTGLISGLKNVAGNMESMMTEKDNVMDSIRSIAAISEQTSASTEEVTATVNTQLGDARKLAAAAEELSHEVSHLQEELSKYIV